jgi:uncharacterized protein
MHEVDPVRYRTTRSQGTLDADGADIGAPHDVAGGFILQQLNDDAVPWIAKFMRTYERAQLADAALCHLAEREHLRTIFTLDKRDFGVYRLKGNRSLKIVP